MLRKWLKENLPKREQIVKNKYLSWLGSTLHTSSLWIFTRRSVSRGVAAGLFAAFIPLPLQMVIAVTLAVLIRGNLIISAAATWITNPITFLPFNYFIYEIGKIITHDSSVYQPTEGLDWHGQDWNEIMTFFLDWLQSLGKPFLVGLPIVAFGASVLGYIIVNILWRFIILFEFKYRNKND